MKRLFAYIEECFWWWPIDARLSGIWHWLRGHKLHWRYKPDLWIGCTGEIYCQDCPDTKDEAGEICGLVIWCRYKRTLGFIGQIICGIIGHPEFRHPKRAVKWAIEDGQRYAVPVNPDPDDAFDKDWVYLLDSYYCYRCGYDFKVTHEWPIRKTEG